MSFRNASEQELDYEPDENTPLIGNEAENNQPTSSAYLGLSSSSALSIPENRVLRLLNQVESEINPNEQSSTTSRVKNYNKELKEKLKRDYPIRFVVFNSVLTILISSFLIVCERTESNHFELSDITVISYRSLNGLILLGSCLNLLYSVLAFITIFFRNYFLIQLVAILNIISCFISFIYLIASSIIVLVFSLLGGECDYVCILVRSSMIVLSAVITVLNATYFILVQFHFLKLISINYSYVNSV